MSAALIAQGLACGRGGLPVLEGVSFEVQGGGALILRGANGIGKTTLLRVLAGLQAPLAGTLSAPLGPPAYAAHSDAVKGQMTVAENLTFWAGLHGRGDIAPALAAMALGPLHDRPAMHLSAGQRRRLGLARLWVTGRALWLLDEPTVSLDAESTARLNDGIAAHLAGGGAAVIATHVAPGIAADALDLAPYRARAPRDAFEAGTA